MQRRISFLVLMGAGLMSIAGLHLLLDGFFLYAQAQSADPSALQKKIDQRHQDIQALEAEIQTYQKQIDALSGQAQSLSATIKSLDLTQKKLAADSKVTEDKISAKTYEIQSLASRIDTTVGTISDNERIVAHAFTEMGRLNERSLPELLLASDSLSGAWDNLDKLGTLQSGLFDHIDRLRAAKTSLEANKQATERAKADLVALRAQLQGQRSAVLATAAEKNTILRDTKQSESQFQRVLANKKALQEAFQQEVLDYESQLKIAVDTSKIPHTGTGVLSWPLDAVTITQYFGNTPFATKNPQIYNGKGHTGVDFRASIGTPIKAALAGVVSGVGNSDLIPTCYSYGKWVMVSHANGLSTLYAHLSVQNVSVGQNVSTGEILGYSGNTGYTTGPHLHFGVYATQGVVITKITNSKNCKGAVIPMADFKAYLNPLSYL